MAATLAILKGIAINTPHPQVRYQPDLYEVEAMVPGPSDHGRVVGKRGAVIWSINSILWWIGSAQVAHPIQLNLVPPSDNKERVKMPYKPITSWQSVILTPITEMLDTVLTATFKTKQAWTVEKLKEPGHARINIRLEGYLQTAMLEPNYEEAIKVLIHAAGASRGYNLEVNVTWA